MTDIVIPNTVTNIGSAAFWDCGSLTSFCIPNGVTSILDYTFMFCYSLRQVSIPNSVTNIGYSAFEGCAFTNVIIPHGVIRIDLYAFAHCTHLITITIPPSVTVIETYAFQYCSGLARIYFEGNAPYFGDLAFYGVTSYQTNATLYYLPWTTGWAANTAGLHAVLWVPEIQTKGASFGLNSNQFGFNVNWARGMTVVVEACTNLGNPAWVPAQTNTLTEGSSYFSDPRSTDYPRRFYRLRSL